MIKVFVPGGTSFENIKLIIGEIEALQIAPDATQIGGKFDEMIASLKAGDTVIVYSLNFMASLIDLLSTTSKLDELEITLKSIKEPWIDDELTDTRDLFEKLSTLAQAMHSSRTREGLTKARAKGTKLGRKPRRKNISQDEEAKKIAAVERLRREQNLSITAACAATNFPRHAYYNRRAKS